MQTIWYSKMNKVEQALTVIISVIFFALFVAFFVTIDFAILVKAMFVIPVIIALVCINYFNTLEPFQVIVDGDQLTFYTIFRRITLPTTQILSIDLHGAVIIRHSHGRFIFRGKPSRLRNIENVVLHGANKDFYWGSLTGGIPSDAMLWPFLAKLVKLNPQIRITSEYIKSQIDIR